MSQYRSVRSARRVSTLAGLIAIVVATLAGCSSTSRPTADEATSPPTETTIPVDTLAPPTVVTDAATTVLSIDNDFQPKHLQVAAGTKVEFKNIGHNKHNIVPNDPKAANFSVGEDDFPTGSTHSFTFTKPGTYAYYCTLHATPTAGSMRGVITVTK